MVFLWMGWYSKFMCHFGTLGHYEGHFWKTFNRTPMDYIKCALYIFSLEIVKEHTNHHELASFLQTSFSCTKDASDKHNVPVSHRKVFCFQDTHFSQTNWRDAGTLKKKNMKRSNSTIIWGLIVSHCIYALYLQYNNKLDGVGPVDKRPSTNKLQHFL